jgi:hypothetical protein
VVGGVAAALVITSLPTPALAEPAQSAAAVASLRWDAQAADPSTAPRTSVSRGKPVDLAGTATGTDGGPAAGVTVVLDRGAYDGVTVPPPDATEWTDVSQTVTAADGTFRFGVAPTESSVFRARAPASAPADPDGTPQPETTSDTYAVTVRKAVTVRLAQREVRTVPDGSKTWLTGTVRDADGQPVASLPLTVDWRHRGTYFPRGTVRTSPDGSFAFRAWSDRPRLMYWRVRSPQTDTYEAASTGVNHEARHDPFDNAQLNRMVRSVRGSGLKVGVGLVDRRTGRTYNYGYGGSRFYTASVAKVMVAMDVLRDEHARGRTTPSPANARKIRSMIRNSNDAITWSYWRSRGGSAVVARVNKRCRTSIPVHNNTWSMSRPTPLQMAAVLDCLADGRAINAKLSGFLMYQMRNVTTSQRWGIPAANPDGFRQEMNKNGWWRWPCCYFWTVNSTGLFGPGNRYAFTVFTQYGGAYRQSRGERQAYNVTKAMFPWGTVIY